jgi:hypothetical protein
MSLTRKSTVPGTDNGAIKRANTLRKVCRARVVLPASKQGNCTTRTKLKCLFFLAWSQEDVASWMKDGQKMRQDKEHRAEMEAIGHVCVYIYVYAVGRVINECKT